MTGDRKPQRAVQTPFGDAHGRFSPDGRWIAYASNESGRAEVYVQGFPATGNKWQVSTAGGAQPRWRRDGKELLFLSLAGEAMAVEVSVSKDRVFQAGTPRKLFQANPVSVFNGRNQWDVTPDGQRFLINSGGAAPPITVVVNWTAASRWALALGNWVICDLIIYWRISPPTPESSAIVIRTRTHSFRARPGGILTFR